MKIWIGTSGYVYAWNKGIPSKFEWYIAQGFNSVEINASFYRFPSRSWVRAWREVPENFMFSIKVHRTITHYKRLGAGALESFLNFKESLREMDDMIRFWLFQMPPSYEYSEEHINTIRRFVDDSEDNRFVFEFRNKSWWMHIDKVSKIGVFCSVDAPNLPRDIIVSNGVVYLRLHGRDAWYSYHYGDEEMNGIISEVKRLNASEVAIYLNNDRSMLANGKYLLERLL